MNPETMAAIHAECFWAAPRAWSAVEFADLEGQAGVLVVTAEHGFAVVRVVAGEAELLTIAVRPAFQGHGIGRSLLERSMAESRAAGAEAMFLEVAQDNLAARGLYDRSGFSEVGIRKDYYAGPRGGKIAAHVMKLTL